MFFVYGLIVLGIGLLCFAVYRMRWCSRCKRLSGELQIGTEKHCDGRVALGYRRWVCVPCNTLLWERPTGVALK